MVSQTVRLSGVTRTRGRWTALVLLSVLSAGVLTGCAGRTPLFHWGRYEASIYQLEVQPENTGGVQQGIQELEEDLERSRSSGIQVPPGFFAHLGYLYALTGDFQQAARFFEREKVLYPESTRFIDGLLARWEGAQ